jgi:transketolase N-terminal domain/subunit
MKDTDLHLRLLNLLYTYNEEHVGSCFTCIDIMDDIFKNKKEDDIFINSNGHSAYALYVILEKYHNVDADYLAKKHGGHPNFDETDKIYCSTGSLGSGLPIAVGRAIGNPNRKVYVTISDGECAEGSVWESLRFIHDHNIKNIEVHVNANGWACYDPIDVDLLEKRIKSFLPTAIFHRTSVEQFPFLTGLSAHYMKLTEEQYNEGVKILKNEC